MVNTICSACLQPNRSLLVCPHCGWSKTATASNPNYLPPGTIVHPPYQVARVLGQGGFGVTYLGWDDNLQIKVAIKEYLPREFAQRNVGSGQVLPYSEDTRQHFSAGLNSFLEEARILAKFQQHPGIVSVLAFFRAFGTGYMVMEYIEGETLKNYLQQRGRLNWTQTLDIFMQVMDALRAVHQAGLLHRDIAPDNIYLCGDGRIKLLDFGAAQGDMGKFTADAGSTVVMVKQGFAPEEQYRERSDQGTWSDVYSVAASMYYCLTGQPPADALDRLVQDLLKPPSAYGVEMPVEAEQVLMTALAVSSLQRPQSIEILQNQFVHAQTAPIEAGLNSISKLTQSRQAPMLSLPCLSNNRPAQGGIFHWQRWVLVGILCVFLLMLVFRQARNQTDKMSTTLEQTAGIKSVNDSEIQQDVKQIELERQAAAEEFKRQQAAALQRLEENSLKRESVHPNQPDARQVEHLRSLCAEWGATMDCKKNQ